MTEEVNVGLGAPSPKKGMSKGCMVSLIVAGALIILIIALFFVCMSKKKDILNFGVSTMLNSSKVMLVESNTPDVDTVSFNKIIDGFQIELYADTVFIDKETDSIKFVEISNIFSFVQYIMDDKIIDSSEVRELQETLIELYPIIAPETLESEIIDSLITM